MMAKIQDSVEPFVVRVDDLTRGAGVARRDGKAVFVEGALPGEEVRCVYTARRSRRDEARTVGSCGPRRSGSNRAACISGSAAAAPATFAANRATRRQTALVAGRLTHIGKVRPEQVLEPMIGPLWGYRRRARLGSTCRQRGRTLIGFRERHSPFVADLRRCEVLDERLGGLLEPLAQLIDTLSIRDRLPQIEIAGGDETMGLNFRVLAPPSVEDRAQLRRSAAARFCALLAAGWAGQRAGIVAEQPELGYRLPDFDLELKISTLALHSDQRRHQPATGRAGLRVAASRAGRSGAGSVLRLGNFTLALARRAREVVGVEGDTSLVEWARHNAARNDAANAIFHAADLTGDPARSVWARAVTSGFARSASLRRVGDDAVGGRAGCGTSGLCVLSSGRVGERCR